MISKFKICLLIIVLLEAFTFMFVLRQSSKEINGGDGLYYHQTAINLIDNFSYSMSPSDSAVIEPLIGKTPGYSFFVAIVYFFTNKSVNAVRFTQFFLIWLTACGIYNLAKYYADEKTAKISGILCATYIPLIFLAGLYSSEILAAFLLVWTVLRAKQWQEEESYSGAILFGFTISSLILVRSNWSLIVFPLIIPILLKLFQKNKKVLPQIAVFGAICIVLLTPWLVRNYNLCGRFTFSLHAPQSLYASALQYSGKASNEFTMDDWKLWDSHAKGIRGEIEEKSNLSGETYPVVQQELLEEKGFKRDTSEEWKNIGFSQIIESLPKRFLSFWDIFYMTPDVGKVYVTIISKVYFVILFALTLFGIYLEKKSLFRDWILLLPSIYITLVHTVFHVETRYSLPARPFLLIFTSVGLMWVILFVKRNLIIRIKDRKLIG